jgi:plastocyanin
MLTRRKTVAVALTAATAVAGAAAAAGASGGGHAAATKTVRINADKSKLKFAKSAVTVTHGRVTFVMGNPSSLPHAIAVKGKGLVKKGKTVNKGGTSRVTVSLKKGAYTFYCPVDGHEAAGMKGRLTVK